MYEEERYYRSSILSFLFLYLKLIERVQRIMIFFYIIYHKKRKDQEFKISH